MMISQYKKISFKEAFKIISNYKNGDENEIYIVEEGEFKALIKGYICNFIIYAPLCLKENKTLIYEFSDLIDEQLYKKECE